MTAEAISYLGIILVAASGTVVVARFWDDLHSVGRLAVGLLVGPGFVRRRDLRGADP